MIWIWILELVPSDALESMYNLCCASNVQVTMWFTQTKNSLPCTRRWKKKIQKIENSCAIPHQKRTSGIFSRICSASLGFLFTKKIFALVTASTKGETACVRGRGGIWDRQAGFPIKCVVCIMFGRSSDVCLLCECFQGPTDHDATPSRQIALSTKLVTGCFGGRLHADLHCWGGGKAASHRVHT